LISFRVVYVFGAPEHLQGASEMVGEYGLVQIDQTGADT